MLAQGNDCMVSWYIMCGLDCAFLGVQALFCRLLWRYAFPAMFASNRMVMVGNHLSWTMIQPPARKYVVVKPSPFQSLRGSSPKVPKGVQCHGHGMHWRPWNWANNYHRHEFNRTLSMDTRYCSIDHHLEIYRAIHSHLYIYIYIYIVTAFLRWILPSVHIGILTAQFCAVLNRGSTSQQPRALVKRQVVSTKIGSNIPKKMTINNFTKSWGAPKSSKYTSNTMP